MHGYTSLMYRDRNEKEEARRKIRDLVPGMSDLSHIHRHTPYTEWDMLLQQMSALSVFMGCLWPWMCLRHRLQKHTNGLSHKNKARQKFMLAMQPYASDFKFKLLHFLLRSTRIFWTPKVSNQVQILNTEHQVHVFRLNLKA